MNTVNCTRDKILMINEWEVEFVRKQGRKVRIKRFQITCRVSRNLYIKSSLNIRQNNVSSNAGIEMRNQKQRPV